MLKNPYSQHKIQASFKGRLWKGLTVFPTSTCQELSTKQKDWGGEDYTPKKH